jgi:hypothetical protein
MPGIIATANNLQKVRFTGTQMSTAQQLDMTKKVSSFNESWSHAATHGNFFSKVGSSVSGLGNSVKEGAHDLVTNGSMSHTLAKESWSQAIREGHGSLKGTVSLANMFRSIF